MSRRSGPPSRGATLLPEQRTLLTRAHALAFQHHQAGRLAEAEPLYAQVVSLDPSHAEALHHLGLLLHQTGRSAGGAELVARAVALRPGQAEMRFNLGTIQHALGQREAALASYQRAIRAKPGFTEAYLNLGNLLLEMDRVPEALQSLRRAVAGEPGRAVAHYNLGNALVRHGDAAGAEASYRRALALAPALAEAWLGLALAQAAQGQGGVAEESAGRALAVRPGFSAAALALGQWLLARGAGAAAEACWREALAHQEGAGDGASPELQAALADLLACRGDYPAAQALCRTILDRAPGHVAALNTLGAIALTQGQAGAAVPVFRASLAAQPGQPEVLSNLGAALQECGDLDGAARAYGQAVALAPHRAGIRANQAALWKDTGDIAAAVAGYEAALALAPGDADLHRSLLGALLYHPDLPPQALWTAHEAFAARHTPPAQVLTELPPLANRPDPGRRLRLGYLGSDFRTHPIARNLEPLLRHADRDAFEIILCPTDAREDETTQRLRALSQGWCPVHGLSDADAAARLREQGVDILVSLAGHLDRNRPLVCAWRPAPLCVSFHDLATSGLSGMDALITDRHMTPRLRWDGAAWGAAEQERFRERPLRLPSFVIADPLPADGPGAGPLPLLARGSVSFGCFNNPSKLNLRVLVLWGGILAAMPEARLVLKYKNWYGESENLRRSVLAPLVGAGARPDQVAFVSGMETLAQHLTRYAEIDIALDPFPFSGSTTSFEALGMGVPVITLPGPTMASRWTASMLETLGLPDLIAASPAAFQALAAALAADPARLVHLRATLGAQVTASPLCNAPRRARQVERLYRALWRRWCMRQGAPVALPA